MGRGRLGMAAHQMLEEGTRARMARSEHSCGGTPRARSTISRHAKPQSQLYDCQDMGRTGALRRRGCVEEASPPSTAARRAGGRERAAGCCAGLTHLMDVRDPWSQPFEARRQAHAGSRQRDTQERCASCDDYYSRLINSRSAAFLPLSRSGNVVVAGNAFPRWCRIFRRFDAMPGRANSPKLPKQMSSRYTTTTT